MQGHGVGRNLWEEPQVFHFGRAGTGVKLRPGIVFTIEPMMNMSRPEIRMLADRWTVSTADGSRPSQYKHTMAITDGAPELLTVL